jgi:hypothetical protein
MSFSDKEQAAGLLAELIQDAEYRRDMVESGGNFRGVRQEWLERAWKAIEEVRALKVLSAESFLDFNNPDITGSLSEYEGGIDADIAAAEATRKAFDRDIKCLRGAAIRLLPSSQA